MVVTRSKSDFIYFEEEKEWKQLVQVVERKYSEDLKGWMIERLLRAGQMMHLF